MLDQVRAVFRDVAFYPLTPCAVPENSQVDLMIRPARIEPPLLRDPKERRRVLEELTAEMMQRTLAADAARLTRDQMHERR
jgi:hypothetical protein